MQALLIALKNLVKLRCHKNSIVTSIRLWTHCVIQVYAPTKAPYFCFMLYQSFQRHLFCLALYLNYHILLISLRLGLVLQIKELYAFILIFRLQYIMPGNHVQDLSFKNSIAWKNMYGYYLKSPFLDFLLDDFDFIFYHPICSTYYIVDT